MATDGTAGLGEGDRDASRWELLERLFDEALAQSPERRSRWLADRVPDAATRADVEVMLAAHEGRGSLDALRDELLRPLVTAKLDRTRRGVAGPALPGYTIDRELGGGGMSRVYLAHEEALGRTVVIKLLSPELTQGLSAERFNREIRLVARLQEPHIVPILSAGTTEDGVPYYTMPFARGESLRVRISRGAIPLGEAVGILRDVARALAYAHEQGIVHRDIKPENILLNEGTAVVTDFGIAKAIAASTHAGDAPGRGRGATLTQAGTSLGTPAYMSPEQAAGDPVDQRTDLYAWGMVAYELLAGRHPFAGKLSLQQLLAAQLSEVPSVEPLQKRGVPPELVTLVRQCVDKELARRPPTARALLEVLDPLVSASGPVAVRPRVTAGGRRWALLAGVAVLASGAAYLATRGRVAASPGATTATVGDTVRSLVVLPFANVGGDSTDAYLAHGLTDELALVIGRMPGMRVAPRVSARVLAGRGMTPSEIARELGVEGVLSGSVRRSGDRLRVSIELVNARSGVQLLDEQLEESRGDVFAVEDRIAQAIVNRLRLRLPGGMARTVGRGTSDPQAYDDYLRGRYFWSLRSEMALQRAIDFFSRAVERDSAFVPALSGLADAYAVSAFYGYVAPAEGFSKAKTIASRALSLDSLRAEPHASLAYTAMYHDLDWRRAEREFARAIQLDSTYATAHQWSGNFHTAMGNDAATMAALRTAERLDPLNRIAVAAVCWGDLLFRRPREAIVQCDKAIELDSTFGVAYLWKGQALEMLGDRDRALAELQKAVSLSGRSASFVAALAHAYATFREGARARALLSELVSERYRYAPSYEIALVHVALGDVAESLRWLERAFTERSHSIALMKTDPALDPLRREPRFAALLERAGLR